MRQIKAEKGKRKVLKEGGKEKRKQKAEKGRERDKEILTFE